MRKKIFVITLILIAVNICFSQTNRKLTDEINQMFEIDQKVQSDIIEAFKIGATKEKQTELDKIKVETFKKHISVLKKIIAENGYPTYDLVGKDAGDRFFTMIQHADSDITFQEDCLKKIEKLVKKKQANGKSYAFLTDRVNLNSGKQQIYGSQVDYDKDGNAFSKNLKNSKKVNKLRAKVGLEPIEDYLRKMTELHQQMNRKN